MVNNHNLKFAFIILGCVLIFGFFGDFLIYKSPLDLLFITMGIMMIIIGLYNYCEKINKSLTYFMAMFAVNIFQWLIVIYTLLFSQIYLSGDYFIVMAVAPIMTISLTYQFLKKDSIRSKEDLKGDGGLFLDKTKYLLMAIGFVLIFFFGGGFLLYKSPLDLFIGSIGLMCVILGFHYEKNAEMSFNTSEIPNNNVYSENMNGNLFKNIKVTPNYFWAMLGVLIFQLLIVYYLYSVYLPIMKQIIMLDFLLLLLYLVYP